MAFVILVTLAMPYHAAAVPPPNDDFDSATVITSLPFTDILEDADLSVAGDDPAGCLPGATAWYKLTPSANQRAKFTTSAPHSVALDLYTGTRGHLVHVACYPRSYFVPPFSVDLDAGATYYLMASTPWTTGVNLTVSAEIAPPGPANDDFDSATEINSQPFHISVDTTDAIDSFDDPAAAGSYLARTVWYRWTAPGKRRVQIDMSEGAWPFGVYTGTRRSLTPVSVVYYSTPPVYEFDAVAGKTYYLMFGTNGTQSGDGVLDLSFSAKGFSNVSLDASRSRLVYGHSVRLSGHVTAISDPAGDTVSIYRRTSRGSVSRFLVGTRIVDENGNFSLRLKPDRNWFYDAQWAGDDASLPDVSGTKSVKVAPRLGGRLHRFHHTSGGYKIYRPGATPLYVVTIAPHLRTEIGVRLQVNRGGVWQRYASEAFAPNKDGVMAVVIHGLSVGAPYRIRAVYRSDGYHLDAHSSWSYLKVSG
jgi:hypothetical protein